MFSSARIGSQQAIIHTNGTFMVFSFWWSSTTQRDIFPSCLTRYPLSTKLSIISCTERVEAYHKSPWRDRTDGIDQFSRKNERMMLRASFSFDFSIKVNRLHNNNTVILENASDFYRTRYKLDKWVFLSIFLKPESYLFYLLFSCP